MHMHTCVQETNYILLLLMIKLDNYYYMTCIHISMLPMYLRYMLHSIIYMGSTLVCFLLNFPIGVNVKSFDFHLHTFNRHILVQPLLSNSIHSIWCVCIYACLVCESIRSSHYHVISCLHTAPLLYNWVTIFSFLFIYLYRTVLTVTHYIVTLWF